MQYSFNVIERCFKQAQNLPSDDEAPNLKFKQATKHLDIIIDSNLIWRPHVDELASKN